MPRRISLAAVLFTVAVVSADTPQAHCIAVVEGVKGVCAFRAKPQKAHSIKVERYFIAQD
jgi:hypothetical protein